MGGFTLDASALARCIEHRGSEAFTEGVGRYADMVYAACRPVFPDAPEAENAAPECLDGLARGLPGQALAGAQILIATGGLIVGRLLEKESGRPIPFAPVHTWRERPRSQY
ncbi:MAG: hypothetical protein JXR94_15685 [Candidatus Hydrogenedentes bacterium]|nr:hypothetical protein [Candidatus Hydrogenedentota bacterium]